MTNRRSVDAYRVYQDECIDLAESINKEFADEEKFSNWKPIIFQTEGNILRFYQYNCNI